MSRIYDAQEANVIDEALLRRAVDEQVLEAQSAAQQEIISGTNDAIPVIRNANQDPIDFCDVRVLRLGYENILRIDNLWHFKGVLFSSFFISNFVRSNKFDMRVREQS